MKDLSRHSEPFVTTDELARYWSISRKQIYKHIESGALVAIRLGPRSLRIPTRSAIEFERRAAFAPREEERSDADRARRASEHPPHNVKA